MNSVPRALAHTSWTRRQRCRENRSTQQPVCSPARMRSICPGSGAIAVCVLTVSGLTLPAAPAQLGTTQLAFVVGFELVGAAAAPAFAASLVYTAAVVVMMMAVGAVCWMTAAWAPLAPQKSK